MQFANRASSELTALTFPSRPLPARLFLEPAPDSSSPTDRRHKTQELKSVQIVRHRQQRRPHTDPHSIGSLIERSRRYSYLLILYPRFALRAYPCTCSAASLAARLTADGENFSQVSPPASPATQTQHSTAQHNTAGQTTMHVIDCACVSAAARAGRFSSHLCSGHLCTFGPLHQSSAEQRTQSARGARHLRSPLLNGLCSFSAAKSQIATFLPMCVRRR